MKKNEPISPSKVNRGESGGQPPQSDERLQSSAGSRPLEGLSADTSVLGRAGSEGPGEVRAGGLDEDDEILGELDEEELEGIDADDLEASDYEEEEEDESGVSDAMPDPHYNLVSVLYHALQGAEICGQYVEDAEEDGDHALARFFREVQAEEKQRAIRAKALLGERLVSEAGQAEEEIFEPRRTRRAA